ncbi:MAG TPA: lysylphosphatidylglycerol synthase domain-containing protein, partial [Terriglobales bacterium]|nr:lysylphosphatidylglycerol synthase domain-containing protein [Terriglobales bacterium]
MSARRLAGRLLAVALVAGALLFLGRTIVRNSDALRDFDWDVDAGLLGASLVAHVVVLSWGVVVWHRVLLHTTSAAPAPLGSLMHIWFVSSVARYIPGKIWQFVAAAQLASRAGLASAAILTSLAVQVGFTLLAAALVAAATLPLPDSWPVGRAALLVGALIAAVLLSHPRVLRTALGLIPRALHRDVVSWGGAWRDGIVLLALSVVSWLLYGVAFWLFVAALVELPAAALLPLAGVNALSFLAGYVVFVVPAGLGVREAAMTTLLAEMIPVYVGVVVAALSRLWTIAAELIGAGACLWLERRQRRAASGPTPPADTTGRGT